jgi:tetratricopeptide (TPR) repeat protein
MLLNLGGDHLLLPMVPREIVYVQKLHFLGFLLSLVILVALLITTLVSVLAGVITVITGFCLAYATTVKKQCFIVPARPAIAQRLAQNLTHRNLQPVAVATVATQLFYMLGDHNRSETLLQAYLPCDDPLLHTTLADIYLHQNKYLLAIECLEPVLHLNNPLVHWTYGRIFIRLKDYACAVKHLESARAMILATGLPKAETGFLNRTFMAWSVKSSLHHALAECYHHLGNPEQAKICLRRGNLYLIDFSLWQLNF